MGTSVNRLRTGDTMSCDPGGDQRVLPSAGSVGISKSNWEGELSHQERETKTIRFPEQEWQQQEVERANGTFFFVCFHHNILISFFDIFSAPVFFAETYGQASANTLQGFQSSPWKELFPSS